MTKPKAPETSLLLFVLKGFSAWANKAGYEKALDRTFKIIADAESAVERLGGRLLAFENDSLSAVFLDLSFSGVPHASRAGSTFRAALKTHLKAMKGVQVLAGVTLARVPKSRLRKDLSNLESFCRPALRGLQKTVETLPPGSPLALTDVATEAGGKKVDVKPHPKRKKLTLLRSTAAPASASPKIDRVKEGPEILRARLEPVLMAEPSHFSVAALRLRKPTAREGGGPGVVPREPFAGVKETAALFGGGILPGSGDTAFALFSDLTDGVHPACSAVRFGFLAPEPLRRRLRKRGVVEAVGVGVASGKAPFGELQKKTGKIFRQALQDARALASRMLEPGPRVDVQTKPLIEAEYNVGPGKAKGKSPGFPVRDSGLAPPRAVPDDLLGKFTDAALGSSVRRVRDLFRRAARGPKNALVSLASADESARALGASALARIATGLGWRVLAARCSPASLWRPLGPWRDILSLLADVGPSDPPSRVRSRLASLLEATASPRDGAVLDGLSVLFHATGEDPPLRSTPASLKRCLAEKGLHLLFSGCAAATPTLFLLEEGHLADASSLEFVQAIREALRGRPAVFAVAHDPETRLHKPDLAVSLKTPGVTPGQMLARSVLGTLELPKKIREQVDPHRGNPWRVTMALEALKEKRALVKREDRWELEPDKVPKDPVWESLVKLRLRSLPPPLKGALGEAALLGGVVAWSDFATLHPGKVLETLLALERLGWIEPNRHGRGGTWRFTDSATCKTASAVLTVRERAEHHARTAAVLMKTDGSRAGEVGHRVAWHLKEGGYRKEFSEALILQGRDAKALGFPNEAAACLGEVLRIPRPNDLAKATLILEHAEALSELGRASDAIAQIESALKSKAVRIPRKKKVQGPV
ncbi:MAG: ATP-binding protein [Planctomycetota bacterium]|jgi:class 3 adenylate cyclase